MFAKRIFIITAMCVIFILSMSVLAYAQMTDTEDPASDESETFLSVSPDALIVLDLSGSMEWNPAGGSNKYGSTTSCTADTANCTGYGYGWSCSGGFCSTAITGCSVKCSRVEIAKRALFSIMDDDNNGIINDSDMTSLNVRIGYMRFRDGDDTGGDYTKGNNRMITLISALGKSTGTSYQMTYCGNSTSCASTVTSCSSTSECIANASAVGGTPLTSSLKEARSYLNAHKDKDTAKACRQKFAIVLTDGADTYTCSGSGAECQEHMYKRRRDVVAAAKQLYDSGYRVFMIGFGSTMPDYLKNTLNWAAYYGGTDNPLDLNSGSTSAYSVALGCRASTPVTADCCDMSANPTGCFPSGVTGCTNDTTDVSETCQGASTSHFKSTANDPGYLPLSGYAFIASDADQLTNSLKNVLATISASTYSFTSSSIQAVRTVDENYVYEASFTPVDYDPFWKGHLKRFSIGSDGNVSGIADWDAGEVLKNRSDARNMYTLIGGAITDFSYDTSKVNETNLQVADGTTAQNIITFIRGGEQSGANAGWRLGDIFHSSPLSIGTPNILFFDRWDSSDPKAYQEFRSDHIRESSNGTRIILVGANDGQLHAFQTGEAGGTGGKELWSFIPPNLLPKLQFIAHSTHPTSLLHHYFVDGPSAAAEVWLGTGTIGSTYKTANQWHTILVMSEGRGGMSTLWSSSSSCDSGFSASYSSTYSHYCGFYAFDISKTVPPPGETPIPIFKWKLGGTTGLTATQGNHLAQAWSKMFMGRVRINNVEKWVGLVGGGYSGGSLPKGTTAGKGFYVVDLSNGSILWTFTHDGPSGGTNGKMDYDLVAGPVAVDYDNDGFLDTAYVGDLGGNVWRFKFCLENDGTSCGTSNWSGAMLFDSSSGTIRPIYTSVAVTVDPEYNLWVYFGTGDKNDPTAANAQEKMHAVRDSDRSSTYTISDLDNLTADSSTFNPVGTNQAGWYINIEGTGGQKILAEPVIFEGRLYFTTYDPANANDPCDSAGSASLYVVDYLTGGGKLESGVRRKTLSGKGIPSAPIISRNPYGGTDVYVSTSVETTADASHTDKITDPNVNTNPPNSMIYWQDRRIR